MDMTRKRISLILELMAIFLSFQITFSLVTAAMVFGLSWSLDPSSLAYPNCDSKPFSNVVVVVDSADLLVVEAFYGSDQVGVTHPHGCPQGCIPNSWSPRRRYVGVVGTCTSHRVF